MPYAAPVHRHVGYRTAEQRRAEVDECRDSASKRGYDKAWKDLRLEFLAEHPYCECEVHLGKDERAIAQVVDHIQSIHERPDLRLAWGNLRAMTKRCHDRRTAQDQGFARTSKNFTPPK